MSVVWHDAAPESLHGAQLSNLPLPPRVRPPSRATAGHAITEQAGKAMSDDDDFSELDDPTFLAARRLVREEVERTPEGELSATLTARYEAMNVEFLRRARIAWEAQ